MAKSNPTRAGAAKRRRSKLYSPYTRHVREEAVADLADELFAMVQESQGMSFVSDDEGSGMSVSEFFERIRGRLAWSIEATRLMRQFLRKHGESYLPTPIKAASGKAGK